MSCWKWTKGEPYQKSYKNNKVENNFNKFREIENSFLNRDINLLENKNTESIENTKNTKNESIMNNNLQNEFKKKKDFHNEKLSSRHMIIQTNVNPYLESNNYIDDLINQDEFLRPRDSNFN
jgi:uncharacterized membrane protein YgaE (UPF0421/DUF939 family)